MKKPIKELPPVDEVMASISFYVEGSGVSWSEFCKKWSVSYSTIHRIRNGADPHYGVLARILSDARSTFEEKTKGNTNGK